MNLLQIIEYKVDRFEAQSSACGLGFIACC